MRLKFFPSAGIFAVVFATGLFLGLFLFFGTTYAQTSVQDVKGFAWSSNVGWLSFNSKNCDANNDTQSDGVPAACPPQGAGMARYGVNLSAIPTGAFSGFAWSSNIGWVSFNQSDLSGCPSGTCSAAITSSAVNGWAKSIANNPGWTGWVHLSNASPAYEPTLGADGKFTGFSWGENVIGWMKWNPSGGGVYIGIPPVTPPPVTSGTLLQVIRNGSGLVTSDLPTPLGIDCGTDCSERYASSTAVTLVASDTFGYQFSSWGGAASSCGTARTCIVTVLNATTTALSTFNPILQVSKAGNGTVTSSPGGINCGADCLKAYVFGTQVTLTAAPDADYQFLGWGGSGASCGTALTCTVSVTGYTSVLASFSSNAGMLVVTKSANGAVASSDGKIVCGNTCQSPYNNGTHVTLRAQPDIGYEVGSWGGAASSCGTAITCDVVVNGTTNVSITFIQVPACRDGQDNDNDAKTDRADPGCHTDGNPLNSASYDPTDNDETDPAPITICNDGLDNDNDGLIDEFDPNCLNPDGTYNPLDMTENPSYRCSDHVDNDLDGKCDYNGGMCLNPVTGIISQMPADFPECNSPYKNSETVDGTIIEY